MQAGERHGFQERTMGRVGLTRGLIVIFAAVVIGSFLLLQGGRGDDIAAVSPEATTGDTGEGDATGTMAGADGDEGLGGSMPFTDATVSVTVEDGAQPAVDEGELPVDADDPAAPTDASADPSGPSTPSGVTVLVLNGGAAPGTAGRGAEALKAAGYTVLPPRNADTVLGSTVLHVGGREAEALAVAATLTADPAALVAALDPAAPPLRDYGTADVIVVIGPDDLIDLPGG